MRNPRSAICFFQVFSVVAGAACEDVRVAEVDTETDGAVDGDDDTRIVSPPTPPRFEPCPPGWRAVQRPEGATVCDPYPEGGMRECPVGEAHFPGMPGCERLGEPCPSGPFPDVETIAGLPLGPSSNGRFAYVLLGAMEGDGSRERPFGTIEEVPPDTFAAVVLAKGSYGHIAPSERLALVGACPEETRIGRYVQLPGPSGTPDIVANLTAETIDAKIRPIVVTAIHIENGLRTHHPLVEVTRTTIAGGGTLNGDALLNEVVLAGDSEWSLSRRAILKDVAVIGGTEAACLVVSRGSIHIERSIISHCGLPAITVGIASEVSLTDVVIDSVSGVSEGFPGWGIIASTEPDDPPPTLDARRVWLRAIDGIGVVLDTGEAQLRDVVIEDVHAGRAVVGEGIGLAVRNRADLSRIEIAGAAAAGVLALDGASLELSDLRVEAVTPADGDFGYGIAVQGESTTAIIERAQITEVHEFGLLVSGSAVDASDVIVRDLRSLRMDNRAAAGIAAQSSADLSVRRAELVAIEGAGIVAHGSVLDGESLRVRDIRARSCVEPCPAFLPLGIGVGVYRDSAVALNDVLVERFALCGFHVAGAQSIAASNCVLRRGPAAACFEDETVDLTQLLGGVRVFEVDATVAATRMPVPDPAAPFPSLDPGP